MNQAESGAIGSPYRRRYGAGMIADPIIPPLPMYDPYDGTEPTVYLAGVLAYTAALAERPKTDYVREVAVQWLAATYDEEKQVACYEALRPRLATGVALNAATPTDLLCDALGAFGVAQDRTANGDWSLDAEVWHEAARTVVVDVRLEHLAARLDAGTWPINNATTLREFINRAQVGDAEALDAVTYYLEHPAVTAELVAAEAPTIYHTLHATPEQAAA